jgi:hypothetical protein
MRSLCLNSRFNAKSNLTNAVIRHVMTRSTALQPSRLTVGEPPAFLSGRVSDADFPVSRIADESQTFQRCWNPTDLIHHLLQATGACISAPAESTVRCVSRRHHHC